MTENQAGTSDLLQALSRDIKGLVHNELQEAQTELIAKAKAVGAGGLAIGGAGVLGVLAVAGSSVFLQRLLDKVLPRTVSAAVLTAVYGAGAVGLGVLGAGAVRRALPLVPKQTIADLRND